ncbi:hypothetical protein MMC13_001883 [Lambiella insularis]|nr:hypothetical protein [Lambiella insularis]
MLKQLNSRRVGSSSFSNVTPLRSSPEYSQSLADIAAPILYRSPLPSQADLPVYILNATALPDASDVNFDTLFPYVLARLPNDEELIGGKGYEVIFFTGDGEHSPPLPRKKRPGWQWFLRAYHALTRAMRKRLQRLYLVHEKRWVKVTMEMFSSIASPKFRKKIFHGTLRVKGSTESVQRPANLLIVSSMSSLALHVPMEDLLIPPSAYVCDRRFFPDIYVPYVTGRRAFGVTTPLPVASTSRLRLPRVLRECTCFVLADENVKTEGLFRVNARAETVGILKEAYDRGQKFIVWKEGDCILTSSHWKEDHGDVTVEEPQIVDGYSLTTAAALIKLWYADLLEPIFPPASYQYLKTAFGDPAGSFQNPAILDLISEASDWSPIKKMSRRILTMHLLPFLAIITDYQDWNKMSPYNLAVCFAPALIHGPDPTEDVAMAGTVARILESAVRNWDFELSASCGLDKCSFEDLLRLPEISDDREDPLDSTSSPLPAQNMQSMGITLIENDLSDGADDVESEDDKPPLPPRVVLARSDISEEQDNRGPPLPARNNIAQDMHASLVGETLIRRKPVPPLQTPPRYSTIFVEGDDVLPTYTESH